MDDFFTKTKCDRCGGSLTNGRIMSMFNKDCICMKCKAKERRDPEYTKASEADRAEIIKGNYNFPGIRAKEEKL